jgi:hypothetical protein
VRPASEPDKVDAPGRRNRPRPAPTSRGEIDVTTKTKAAEALQRQGTREFEAAIAGPGPVMPPDQRDRGADDRLHQGLEDTFPASDPVAASMGKPATARRARPRKR